jgi:hypothetical protein
MGFDLSRRARIGQVPLQPEDQAEDTSPGVDHDDEEKMTIALRLSDLVSVVSTRQFSFTLHTSCFIAFIQDGIQLNFVRQERVRTT